MERSDLLMSTTIRGCNGRGTPSRSLELPLFRLALLQTIKNQVLLCLDGNTRGQSGTPLETLSLAALRCDLELKLIRSLGYLANQFLLVVYSPTQIFILLRQSLDFVDIKVFSVLTAPPLKADYLWKLELRRVSSCDFRELQVERHVGRGLCIDV